MASITDQIVDTLKELDPNLDVREGTAIFELMVKPLTLVLEPLQQEIDEIKTFQSIADAETMPADELDLLAENFFINRKSGERASVTARIFLVEEADITFEAGAIFTAKNGQTFTNVDSVSFSSAEIRLNQEGELFFFDVPTLSVELTTDANIGADEIVSIDVDVVGFAGVTNPNPATGGQREETNTELVDRIKKSITLRNLITVRGISTILTEEFQNIFEVRVIGFGDPEMHRDTTLGVHVGGRVDVYVDSPDKFKTSEAQFASSEFLPPDAEGIHIDIKKDATTGVPTITDVPFIKIEKVETGTILADQTFSVTAELVEDEDFTLNVEDIPGLPPNTESSGQHFRFSNKEILDLQIDVDHKDDDIRVTYQHAEFVTPVQDFVDLEIQRVVCSDILVKTFIPAFIDMSVIVTPILGQTVPDYKTAIEEFIDNLRSPTVFEVSDIVDLIYNLGADQVDLPITVTSFVVKPDGTTATITSENEINFTSIEDPSVPVTPRIIHTHAGVISVAITEKEGFPN